MCLIIDANRAADVFRVPIHPDFSPLWKWLNGPHGRLVLGGRLQAELERIAAAKNRVAELYRGGHARLVDKDLVAAEETRLGDSCRSNDPHVIALGCLTGARILCTEDRQLMADFQDRTLVPNPQGKIYRNASHDGLLFGDGHGHCGGCQKR